MNRELQSIIQRLSLRKPQADSLEILAEVLERIPLGKDIADGQALAAVRERWSSLQDFERDFPSLCFALATGVGKTRLMGAFISYLYLTGQSRHFFVLAPNTTIYNKLINDFTPGHPKYVFKGIAEFATNPPLIITGDNYESGRGVRHVDGRASDLFGSDVHINIFNIDKINKEEGPRGTPKMKKLQETIGESYYDYLSGLDDLVVVMDEAHRYRASAGSKAIDGLRPILGLELTATPKTVGARSVAFRNVIYSYGLGEAMADGFVKEPAVATRKDFDPKSVPEERLEQIKLEDAVHNHDHVAVELDRYHRVTGRPKVHPFILVVAQDTDHARRLRTYIESEDFFRGRFKDKVAEVHSALRGEESEEATQRLVSLEQDGRTEIVIHVNKLKEGWDVTNLYTIVPLRASASDILTEQTLGRGLRLPYGERVTHRDDEDFAAVDRLTVIAHDRFDEIIQKAREPGSIVMKHIEIGEGCDVSSDGAMLVTAPSIVEIMITGSSPSLPGLDEPPAVQVITLQTPEETRTAEVTLEVIRKFERKLGSADELRSADVQRQIADAVREIVRPAQSTLEGIIAAPRVEEIVAAVTQMVAERTMSIPQILVLPKRQTTFEFADFDLKDLSSVNVRPIDDGLIIQTLRTEARTYLAKSVDDPREERLEDYLVRFLIERNEIDYDAHADLLYKLAGQVVDRISSYLETRAEVENVLLRNGRQLAEFIFAQMMQNYVETPLGDDDYEVRVTRGFSLLEPQAFNVVPEQKVRDFRKVVTPMSDTKRQVFGGFRKCCYSLQKFDSDPERRFAVLVDADPVVEKWLKPGRAQFQIEYRSGDNYEPDFVIETDTAMVICEVKNRDELTDPVVLAKAKAAVKWCRAATQHAEESRTKPWTYVLIGDDQVIGSATLPGLMARFSRSE
ncbi:DEAD/DEAH box helicase family protein [Burkholderia sp. AU31624]|uniref:DEAD/DEAH box helicase n=1 Tax=Burkholderia sp. AU31624 TaxID=2879629 RepID=UPI001CF42209|nr:DEAD/DEAH box helicase family protein [Burkholderia sp. AU31624]MCA8258272.1 DEAD/DEAH box helicase family protein [Burkholderia sp. AU31624]